MKMSEVIFSMVICFLIASIGDFYFGSGFGVFVLIMAVVAILLSLFAICKYCMLLWEMIR